MYYKLGKAPHIIAKHNLESWDKIKKLLVNRRVFQSMTPFLSIQTTSFKL